MVELPYGRTTCRADLGSRRVTLVEARRLPPPRPLPTLLDEALAAPIGLQRVEELVQRGDRVTVVVSDTSRDEPRAALIEALRARLPTVTWTLAIATGTHGPCDIAALGLPDALLADATIVNHDGHRVDGLVDLGVTTRGTPVRIHRCVVDAELVIATGCIRPHYFAGFGAGVKAMFPGLGEARAIRHNHALKVLPGARAGIVDGNPCRDDLEEAVARVPTPTFLLDGVAGPDGRIHAAVAGDVRAAFRAGAALARGWFTVDAPRAPVVVASDGLPVTASLYQAAKIAAAVAPLVEEDGLLVIVAECADGTGPLDVVNDAIVRIGVLPRLARGVRLRLVSRLPPDVVGATLFEHAASVAEAIADQPGPVTVVPRASQLLFEERS